MIIEDKNDKDIVFFAFRYALGRTTTAPVIIIKKIKENWDDFNIYDKEKMVSEIERDIEHNFVNKINSSKKYVFDEWNNFKLWAESKIREEKIDTIVD